MSVPNQTPYIIYNANGLTTVFPFEFYIIIASDIRVSINGETVTSGFTVSGVGNVSGGNVTFITPPANGSVVMLERVVPTYRLTEYQDNGDLLADTVNKDFDRLWMAIQYQAIHLGLALRRPLFGGPFDAEGYRISKGADPVDKQDFATKNYVDDVSLVRALRVPEAYVDAIPPVAQRANKLLAFNSAGKPITVLPESGSASEVMLVLAGKDGYSYIGELQSVADFFGLVKQDGVRVKLRSWYSGWASTSYGKPNGGGDFIYQASVPKSKHDGCIYFSPTVPYSTTLSEYVTGTGETDPSGSGVWVRDIGDSAYIHTDWAGIGDGATSTSSSAHSDAIQNVFDACSDLNKHVFLDEGWIHLEKAVYLKSFTSNSGAIPGVVGVGIGSSYVLCYPLGTDNYSLNIESTLTTQSWFMRDIYFREKHLAKTAYMVRLKQITGAVIERVKWGGGYQQLLTQNLLSSTFSECSWFSGYRGGHFTRLSPSAVVSPANAVRFVRCQILSMENQGFWVEGATQFQIIGGSLEGCGSPGDTLFRGVYFQAGSGDGTQGLLVDGLYVESCSGYPFYITHGDNRSYRHTFRNCNFNNNSAQYPVSQIIVLGRNYNYPAGVRMVLEMQGNTFTGFGYTSSSSRPDVVVAEYNSIDHAIFLDYDNLWIANQSPTVADQYVMWKRDPNHSFDGLVSGTTGSVSGRRNIVSVTRNSVGTYVVNVNHTITADTIQLTPVGVPGMVSVTTAPTGTSLTVRTYNATGTLADIDFFIRGTSTLPIYSPSYTAV